MSHVGLPNNFALCTVSVLTHSCTNYRNDTHYWAEISSLEWHVCYLNTTYSLEISYHCKTNIKGNCCILFTQYHVIQLILHCLITKTEGRSAQTAPCTVRFGTEQYRGTNCLLGSIQLTTPITTLTHIAIYYCHKYLHSLCCLTYKSHSWHCLLLWDSEVCVFLKDEFAV